MRDQAVVELHSSCSCPAFRMHSEVSDFPQMCTQLPPLRVAAGRDHLLLHWLAKDMLAPTSCTTFAVATQHCTDFSSSTKHYHMAEATAAAQSGTVWQQQHLHVGLGQICTCMCKEEQRHAQKVLNT
jgi:hypothetical protein